MSLLRKAWDLLSLLGSATPECLPQEKRGRRYGGYGMLHSEGHVDVELSPAGHVVAVWFRDMTLPFEERFVDKNRSVQMVQRYEHQPPHQLVAVEVDPERVQVSVPRMYSKIDPILRGARE